MILFTRFFKVSESASTRNTVAIASKTRLTQRINPIGAFQLVFPLIISPQADDCNKRQHRVHEQGHYHDYNKRYNAAPYFKTLCDYCVFVYSYEQHHIKFQKNGHKNTIISQCLEKKVLIGNSNCGYASVSCYYHDSVSCYYHDSASCHNNDSASCYNS